MSRSFRFIKTLGEGAFGAVHLAEVRDDETDFVQTLAVKWLHARWSQSAEYTSRLRDEARLLALLRHQAIVRVHGLSRIDGRLAILMEAIEGADLGRVERLPLRAALEVTAAVADALDAAWSDVPQDQSAPLHVVHRDIKPSNVMVTPRGAVKVMDFGVARARFDDREAETRSQQFGTARYMAPERWLESVAEAPSDVFSLGITLLELVRGQPIPRPRLSKAGFESDLRDALAPLTAHPEVHELVASMVCYLPEDRPSAAEVASRSAALASAMEGPDLRKWASEEVHQLRNPGVEDELTGTVVFEETGTPSHTLDMDSLEGTDPVLVPPTASLPAEIEAPTERRPVPNRRWPMLSIGLVVVGLLAIGASRLGRTPPEPPRDPIPTAVAAPEPQPVEKPVVEEPVEKPEPAVEEAVVDPPEPVVVQPKPPRTTPRPVPPEPEPAEVEIAAQSGTVRFSVPEGVSVETSARTITARRDAVALPQGTAQITVTDGDRRHRCEILVGSGTTEVRIQDDLSCAQ